MEVSENGHSNFKCGVCENKMFDCEEDLKTHLFENHLKNSNNNCEICGKCFTNINYLKRHIVLLHQNNESNFKCDLCKNSYQQKERLAKHVENKHNQINQNVEVNTAHLKCDFCGRLFKNEIFRKKHIKRSHEIQHKFKCSFCDKSFNIEPEFNRHNG